MDRKRFFKKGLKSLAADIYKTPIGQIVDRQLQGLANLMDPQGLDYYYSQIAESSSMERVLARPPGALPEEEFQEVCTACGDCITACPHSTLFSEGESGPMLEPGVSACLLCEDYPCIAACPEGALLPLESDELPAFGRAKIFDERCLNSSFATKIPRGEKLCRDCVTSCQVPEAIKIGRLRMPIVGDNCTGCGGCIMACPTYPVAITIVAVDAEADDSGIKTPETEV